MFHESLEPLSHDIDLFRKAAEFIPTFDPQFAAELPCGNLFRHAIHLANRSRNPVQEGPPAEHGRNGQSQGEEQ